MSNSNRIKYLSGSIQKNSFGEYRATGNIYQTNDIKNLHEWIYYTCGTYIHALDKQHYGEYMISRYALNSLLYGVLELILWFNETYSKNK